MLYAYYILLISPCLWITQRHLSILSPHSFIVISYSTYIYIGLVVINLEKNNETFNLSSSIIYFLCGIYLFTFGGIFFNKILKKKTTIKILINNFIETPPIIPKNKTKHTFTAIFIFFLGLFLHENRELSPLNIHTALILMGYVYFFSLTLSYSSKLYYIISIILLYILIITTSRHMALECFVSASIAYLLFSKRNKKKIVTATFIISLTVILVMLFGQYHRSKTQHGNILSNETLVEIVTRRFFLVGGKTFDYIFTSNLANTSELQITRQIENLLSSENRRSIAYQVCYEVTEGGNCYDPIGIMGQFYLDFNKVGFFIGMLFYGFFVSLTTRLLFLNKKSILNIAIASILITVLLRTFAYSFNGLLVLICQVIFVYFLTKKLPLLTWNK